MLPEIKILLFKINDSNECNGAKNITFFRCFN